MKFSSSIEEKVGLEDGIDPDQTAQNVQCDLGSIPSVCLPKFIKFQKIFMNVSRPYKKFAG